MKKLNINTASILGGYAGACDETRVVSTWACNDLRTSCISTIESGALTARVNGLRKYLVYGRLNRYTVKNLDTKNRRAYASYADACGHAATGATLK